MSPSKPSALDRRQIFRLFFFGVFGFLLYQLLRILSPFLTALIWSATLALIFYPIHQRLTLKAVSQRHTAALLSSAIVALTVILPVLLTLWFLVRESSRFYPAAKAWVDAVKATDLQSPETFLPDFLVPPWNGAKSLLDSFDLDLQSIFLGNMNRIGQEITGLGAVVAKHILFLIINLMLLMVSLFFFFKDGADWVRRLLEIIPMERSHKQRIAARLYETLTAVVRGAALTAAGQGLLAGIGYAMTGIPFPVSLGLTTALAALIPPLGATLIWLPAGLLYMTHSARAGLFLLLWGAVMVSGLEHILKLILIGTRAKLPTLLLFFGILGGMRVYGFLGLILGPVLIACTLAFIQIYREEYHHSKSP